MPSRFIKGLIDAPSLPGYAHPAGDDKLAFASAGAGIAMDGVNERLMSVKCIASDIGPDRVGDVVIPEGGDLTNYREHPVVCLNHQAYPLPIATARNPLTKECTVEIRPGRDILSEHFFSQVLPDAALFFALIAEGTLEGVSIGFNPLEEPQRLPRIRMGAEPGSRYHKWELLEISHVLIGMNPRAGVISVSKDWNSLLMHKKRILRTYLEKGRIGSEKLTPLVKKHLGAMAAQKTAFLFTGPVYRRRGDAELQADPILKALDSLDAKFPRIKKESSGWTQEIGPKGATRWRKGDEITYTEPATEQASTSTAQTIESKKDSVSPVGNRPNAKLPTTSRPDLSVDEIAEVQSYISEDTPYYEINSSLRSGGKLRGDAKVLQDAILKVVPFEQPVTVYRGFEADDLDAVAEQIQSGTFTDPGFMSTSTNKNGAFTGNLRLTIHARQGLDASYYGSNQDEMLLPAGSEFKVVSLERKGSKVLATLEQITE